MSNIELTIDTNAIGLLLLVFKRGTEVVAQFREFNSNWINLADNTVCSKVAMFRHVYKHPTLARIVIWFTLFRQGLRL